MAHREAIEKHLFEQVTELFGLAHTVTLYDLTNTFFEGEAADQPKAQRGHSVSNRSACHAPPGRLAGWTVRVSCGSEVFAGRADEDKTLEPMLKALHAPGDALVVMDAGIATEDNVAGDNGYRYLVVSRQRTRRFDPERSIAIETRSHHKVHLHKGWMRTAARCGCTVIRGARQKGEGIARRFADRFESEFGSSTRGCRGPAPARGSTLSGSHRADPGALPRCRAAFRPRLPPWTVVNPRPSSNLPSPSSRPWKHKPTCRHHAHPSAVSYCLALHVHDWDPRPCAALHHAHRSRSRSALSSPNSASAPSSTKPRTAPSHLLHHRHRLPTGPDHPQAPRRTRRERRWTTLRRTSKASTVSPPPSAERTAEPSTSARPPVPSNPNSRSTPLSISTPGHQIDRLNTLTVEM